MAVYIWQGQNRSGEAVNGEITAENESEAITKLRAQGVQPQKIKKKARELSFNLGVRVSVKEMVIFTRQFATMIDAGLPLVQALDILASAEPNKGFQRVIYQIKADVEQGQTFAAALGKHPRVFDDLYVNLCHAGEIGGILDSILGRLAVYMEKAAKLASKIKGAFTYPVAILVIAMAVTAGLLVKVIPMFQGMFENMGGAELPGPTQFVIDLSEFMQAWILHILAGIAAFVYIMRAFYRHPRGREISDTFLINSPIFGNIIRKSAVAKFTSTLSTLISSGVPLMDGLEIVARSAGNKVVEKAVMKTREKIAEGRTMVEPLAESGVFPPMVVQMIGVGEATGALDTMLGKIAEFYEEEVDAAVDALTALLEPLMMVVIGGIVGGTLIAMYLPIFSMGDIIE